MGLWMIVMTLMASAADGAGAWALASDAAQVKAGLEASVEAAIASLPGFAKGKARQKLLEQATVCQTYTVRLEASEVAWACDDQPAFVVPRSKLGTPYAVTVDGKSVTATVTQDGDGLDARFAGDNGARTLRMRWTADRLEVTSAIEGNKLAKPVSWTAAYGR